MKLKREGNNKCYTIGEALDEIADKEFKKLGLI